MAAYIGAGRRFYRKRRGIGRRHAVGFVYFIEMVTPDRPVKIGFATNVEVRLSNIGVGTPYDVLLLAKFPTHHSLEDKLHRILIADRIKGEWFRRSVTVESAIAAACANSLDQWLLSRAPAGEGTGDPFLEGG